MTLASMLILLVLVSGVVAYLGDVIAKRVGKRHWRLWGMRPRTTGTVIAVGTGVLISLSAFAAFFLLARDARETIWQAETVRQERNLLRQEVQRYAQDLQRLDEERQRATEQASKIQGEANDLRRDVNQLRETLDNQQKLLEASRKELEASQQQLDQTRGRLRQVQGEFERAQREKTQLLATREQLLQAVREQQRLLAGQQDQLARLEEDRTALQETQRRLRAQVEQAQKRLSGLQKAAKEAQARLATLEQSTRQLSEEKKRLEGDIALLNAQRQEAQGALKDLMEERDRLQASLAAAQKELSAARARFAQVEQENVKLRNSSRILQGGLEKLLEQVLLAEQLLVPGKEQQALDEIRRRVDLRARLLGLRGAEVVQELNLGPNPRLGLLLARPVGVNPDSSKLQIRLDYRAREQLFAKGDVLATGVLVLPTRPEDVQRRLELIRQDAEERLANAGWIPEKLALGAFDVGELAAFSASLASKRGGAKVAVVALEPLYPTDPPKLGFKLVN
ncbi:DUF3084 domain-containing protein [Calidithermus chliarophilus]|uniref:DUF3084 domain-containing protein n=1 Tax=Calidithermus chliarophilus TaxID=52023 RepID=UPI0003F89A5E|nr:DUF3084 domain-containing protein [Calidithermus chliarophilus]